MAGDWIKWTKGLHRKREVVQMAAALGIDRFSVAGRLMAVWEWADDEIGDRDFDDEGCHAFVTLTAQQFPFIDEIAGLPNFASTMAGVDWLLDRGTRLMLPNFGRHNGKTSKTRALAQERQQKRRGPSPAPVTKMSRSQRDKSVTREEKSISLSENGSKPPPANKALVLHFLEGWERTHGTGFPVRWGREGSCARDILAHFRGDLEAAKAVVDKYLADRTPFVAKEQAHSLTYLAGNLQKWVAKPMRQPTPQERQRTFIPDN